MLDRTDGPINLLFRRQWEHLRDQRRVMLVEVGVEETEGEIEAAKTDQPT